MLPWEVNDIQQTHNLYKRSLRGC